MNLRKRTDKLRIIAETNLLTMMNFMVMKRLAIFDILIEALWTLATSAMGTEFSCRNWTLDLTGNLKVEK